MMPSDGKTKYVPIISMSTCSKNIGVVAASAKYVSAMVPLVGFITIFFTLATACRFHFRCPSEFPVLSHAAEFTPEYYIFGFGMCCTAYFIRRTGQYFFHFHESLVPDASGVRFGFKIASNITTISLVVLSICDSDRFFDVHVISTVTFFIAVWVYIGVCHICRNCVLDNCHPRIHNALLSGIQRGKLCIYVGFITSIMFGYIYLARRDLAPSPFQFGVAWESFSELISVLCQLLYIGTLSAELEFSIPEPKRN